MKMNSYVLSDMMNFTFFERLDYIMNQSTLSEAELLCHTKIHYRYDLHAVLRRATRSYFQTAFLFHVLPVYFLIHILVTFLHHSSFDQPIIFLNIS
jgi:hypothetical protein